MEKNEEWSQDLPQHEGTYWSFVESRQDRPTRLVRVIRISNGLMYNEEGVYIFPRTGGMREEERWWRVVVVPYSGE